MPGDSRRPQTPGSTVASATSAPESVAPKDESGIRHRDGHRPRPVQEVFFADETVAASVDAELGLVRATRLRAYASNEEAVECLDALTAGMARLPRMELVLLEDLRMISGRHDPVFEEILRRKGMGLYARFARRAILVRTQTGHLQANRLLREHGADPHRAAAFMSEREALAFLIGPK
jgi:hypothetical protein